MPKQACKAMGCNDANNMGNPRTANMVHTLWFITMCLPLAPCRCQVFAMVLGQPPRLTMSG